MYVYVYLYIYIYIYVHTYIYIYTVYVHMTPRSSTERPEIRRTPHCKWGGSNQAEKGDPENEKTGDFKVMFKCFEW